MTVNFIDSCVLSDGLRTSTSESREKIEEVRKRHANMVQAYIRDTGRVSRSGKTRYPERYTRLTASVFWMQLGLSVARCQYLKTSEM